MIDSTYITRDFIKSVQNTLPFIPFNPKYKTVKRIKWIPFSFPFNSKKVIDFGFSDKFVSGNGDSITIKIPAYGTKKNDDELNG